MEPSEIFIFFYIPKMSLRLDGTYLAVQDPFFALDIVSFGELFGGIFVSLFGGKFGFRLCDGHVK